MKKFTIKVNSTLLGYNVFTIPKELTEGYGDGKSGYILLEGKLYNLKVTGKTLLLDYSYSFYQACVGKECGEKLKEIFCHSFMKYQAKDLKIEGDEFIEVEYELINDLVCLKVIDIKRIENEYTEYFRRLAKRNEISLKETEEVDLKHLISYSSDWIPIEELKKHSTVKKCIYTWIDNNKKYIYIGKANDLVERLTSHLRTPNDYNECVRKYGDTFSITHFRYDIVNPDIADTMLEALEMRSIQTVATLLPNRSRNNQEIENLFDIKDTEWILINNNYAYH